MLNLDENYFFVYNSVIILLVGYIIMRICKIFVGNIKKCLDLPMYKEYGDQQFVGDYQIGHVVCGTSINTVRLIEERVPMLELDEGKFVRLDDVDSVVDRIKFSLKPSKYTLYTEPKFNNDIFVTDLRDADVKYYVRLKRK